MTGDQISAHYDHEAKALYIALTGCSAVDKTLERPEGNFDLDKDGNVVGIEILNAPRYLALAPVAAELGFAHLLDKVYAANAMCRGIQVCDPARLTYTEACVRA